MHTLGLLWSSSPRVVFIDIERYPRFAAAPKARRLLAALLPSRQESRGEVGETAKQETDTRSRRKMGYREERKRDWYPATIDATGLIAR